MAPLKESVNADSVAALADGIIAAWPAFPAGRFQDRAVSGLDALELKDRVKHVTGALAETLTLPFPRAAAVLAEASRHVRLDMFSGWPATDYLATHGLDHLDEAMAAIAVLTPYATGEIAVRPYLDRYQEQARDIMLTWTGSDDEHVRRLACEGARPLLPWASRVPWLMQEGVTVPLLDRLRDDPSEYVRRSVANHVNDIAAGYRAAAVALLTRWRSEGGDHVEKVLRHGLRGLLRTGDSAALHLIGVTPGSGHVKDLTLATPQVPIGGHLEFTAIVVADQPGPLLLKYQVAREGSRRTFHLATKTATTAGQQLTITKKHSFKPVTTRREPPAPYTLTIMVNGTARATADFTLTPARN
jgi:3-methyladenine DNA glycosylase AlkC